MTLALLIALLLPIPAGPVTDWSTIEDGMYRADDAGDEFCVKYLKAKAQEALRQPVGRTFAPALAPTVAQHPRCGKYVVL